MGYSDDPNIMDEDEIWRLQRKKHQNYLAMAAEKAMKRKEEEEKRLLIEKVRRTKIQCFIFRFF